MSDLLTPRWTPLRPHPIQTACYNSPHRYNVVPAGRRSGKTEIIGKRRLVARAIKGSPFIRPRYVAAAPTRDQAKRIYWNDLKELVPPSLIRDISETDLCIRLTTSAQIEVVGMDKPQRIEGSPLDGIVLDEYADMKASAWPENVLPALADRNGWADLIGVPEGRNHYFDTYNYARERMLSEGAASPWGTYTWKSAEILDPATVAELRRTLNDRQFRQECEASFEGYSGVVLFAFDRAYNIRECPIDWRQPHVPLHIGQDFNLNPMTSTVWVNIGDVDYQVDEIVLDSSNTDDLVREVEKRYPNAKGRVTFYPDASGSAQRTSSGGRSDHSIIRAAGFKLIAPAANPSVRDRLNLTNARFCTADGARRAFVSQSCKLSTAAYEKHAYLPGTSDPDKKSGYDHYVDSAGYQFWQRYGIKPTRATHVNIMGR